MHHPLIVKADVYTAKAGGLEAGEDSGRVVYPILTHNSNKASSKKKKSGNESIGTGSFTYHPEEELIDSRAVAVHSYPLKTAPPRDEESFGVEQFGRLVLVETDKLAESVGAMLEAIQA